MIDILPVLNASVLLIMGSMLIFYFIHKAQDSQVKPPGVFVGLTAITWGVSIVCIIHAILFSPKNDWNGVLLTPPLALLNGIDIHALPGKGPLIPSTYGPVFFLIFMPSCFVFESPTWMIMSGVLVNFLVGFLPIFFAVQQTIRFEFKRLGVLSVSGLILLIILQRPSLSSAYFNIHCDTPAIGAAFAACLFVLPRKENVKRASLFWSALFCSLSIWSKQTMLVLAVILSIFILLVYGWKTFGRFVAYLGIINITITAICVWIFGLQNLWFHMIELVRNQPWYMYNLNTNPWLHRYDLQIGRQKIGGTLGHQFATLAVAGLILFRDNLLWLMALVLGIAADISNIKSRRRDWFDEIKKRNWFLFVLVMLFMIPASILPLVKVGGYVNNKAFFEIFLIFSVIIIWSDIRRPIGGISQSALIGIVISLILVTNTPRIIYAFSHTESATSG